MRQRGEPSPRRLLIDHDSGSYERQRGRQPGNTAKWDPSVTVAVANTVGILIKRWFRAEVRGLDNMPAAGGALVVSNHSGGMLTPDVLIFAPAFYKKFGYDRPMYTLAHYGVFLGPFDGWLRRLGAIEASRANAAQALHSGAVVLVFPGR